MTHPSVPPTDDTTTPDPEPSELRQILGLLTELVELQREQPPSAPRPRGPLDPIAPGVYPTALRTGGVVMDPREVAAIQKRTRVAVQRSQRRLRWFRVRRVLRWIGR